MKKLAAVLICLLMVLSLYSCRTSDLEGGETTASTDQKMEETTASTDQKMEETTEAINPDEKFPDVVNGLLPPIDDDTLQMYKAAFSGEACVIDERLGETELKKLTFRSSNTALGETPLLRKTIVDVDRDGIYEYVIQSPEQEYVILRCYNGKVYSYHLDTCDFYLFNTDGSFYWCNSPHTRGMECGLTEILFDRDGLKLKPLYGLECLEYSEVYYVEGKVATSSEYYTYRNSLSFKDSVTFSPFELTCSYPVTAEQAWNLANAYWDYQDGCAECSAGTIWTARIVLIDTPNSDTDDYCFAFRVESNSGGGLEGYECVPPHSVREYDQIFVDAFTGEITASTYKPDGKVISIEEAIEIAENYCEHAAADKEGKTYRIEQNVKESAPDHIYSISIYKLNGQRYDFHTNLWIDKYTGEIMFGYYMRGK